MAVTVALSTSSVMATVAGWCVAVDLAVDVSVDVAVAWTSATVAVRVGTIGSGVEVGWGIVVAPPLHAAVSASARSINNTLAP